MSERQTYRVHFEAYIDTADGWELGFERDEDLPFMPYEGMQIVFCQQGRCCGGERFKGLVYDLRINEFGMYCSQRTLDAEPEAVRYWTSHGWKEMENVRTSPGQGVTRQRDALTPQQVPPSDSPAG